MGIVGFRKGQLAARWFTPGRFERAFEVAAAVWPRTLFVDV
jgi:hypothetical protein